MPRAKTTPDVPTDKLDAMLARLQLGGIRDQLDSLLDEAARANLSTRETLALLCEREIARKDHRRVEMALKLAHFPAVKDACRLRLRGAALDRSQADPRPGRLPLDRQRRERAAARAAGRGQDPPRDCARPRGDPGRLLGAVHDGDGAGRWPRQGARREAPRRQAARRSPSPSC